MIIYILIFLFPYSILAMNSSTEHDVVALLMARGKTEAESTSLYTAYSNTKDMAFCGMLRTTKTMDTMHSNGKLATAAGCSFIERNFCGIPLSSLAEINWVASAQHIDGTTELKLMCKLLQDFSNKASRQGAHAICVLHDKYKQNILEQALKENGFSLHHEANSQQQIFWKKIKND